MLSDSDNSDSSMFDMPNAITPKDFAIGMFPDTDPSALSSLFSEPSAAINPSGLSIRELFPSQIGSLFEIPARPPEVVKLEKKIADLRAELSEETSKRELTEQQIKEIKELQGRKFFLSSISDSYHEDVINNPELIKRFTARETIKAYVVSIDIRRSTELMLKAKNPEAFALFITSLCGAFAKVIKRFFGVFDKFTGDGILAFFPEFYSGKDAGYFAIKSAQICHEIFADVYEKHHQCFNSVLLDVGLGIGVDFGEVHLVQMHEGLTIVGHPVVYACRLGGAPAGKTLLNQQAKDYIKEKYKSHYTLSPHRHEIKHEGGMLSYIIEEQSEPGAQFPEWVSISNKSPEKKAEPKKSASKKTVAKKTPD